MRAPEPLERLFHNPLGLGYVRFSQGDVKRAAVANAHGRKALDVNAGFAESSGYSRAQSRFVRAADAQRRHARPFDYPGAFRRPVLSGPLKRGEKEDRFACFLGPGEQELQTGARLAQGLQYLP